jgi:hypothetical protein
VLAARRLDLPGHLDQAGGPARKQRRHVHDRKSAERVIICHRSY